MNNSVLMRPGSSWTATSKPPIRPNNDHDDRRLDAVIRLRPMP